MAFKVVAREFSRSQPRPRVLVVGLGGLGCPVSELLAQSQACDFLLSEGDTVDASNLPRQWLYTADDIGRKKAEVARERLAAIAPLVAIETTGPWTSKRTLADVSLIIDGCDDADLKFNLADAAVRSGTPIVTGGVIGLRGFVHSRVDARGPCLRCIFEGASDEMRRTCRDAGVLASLPPVVGAVMAAAALRILSEHTSSQLWSIDLGDGRARSSDWPKRPDCPACAGVHA